jgi:nitroreductase
MDLEQALRTTGAIREFEDRDVPEEILYGILDAARFAPSGGNRQAWRVIVVEDPALRARLGVLYLTGWYEYLAMARAGLVPWAPVTDRRAEAAALDNAAAVREQATRGAAGFAERLERVPALLLLLADLRGLAAVDRDHDRYTLIGGASVYPFAWSILLAAHAAGLGGVLTTVLVREEASVLKLVGAPAGWVLAGALALGYPIQPRPTRLRRGAVESFAMVDRFDGPPLRPR